jgi:hypothetical protein
VRNELGKQKEGGGVEWSRRELYTHYQYSYAFDQMQEEVHLLSPCLTYNKIKITINLQIN